MKEVIVRFEKGPFPKKYTAYIKHKKTKKIRNSLGFVQLIPPERAKMLKLIEIKRILWVDPNSAPGPSG